LEKGRKGSQRKRQRENNIGTKLAQAVKLAIQNGNIRDLTFEDQLRVVRALQILEAIPDKWDEVHIEAKIKGGEDG
jgi:hypothetical protein